MVAGQSSWSPTLRWHSQCQEIFQLAENCFWPLCFRQCPTTVVRREDTHQGPGGSRQALAGAHQHSAELALVSWLRHPESDPPTARTSFACKTPYHQGDQEGDQEHRERMASLLRSTKQWAPTPLEPSTMSCSLSGRRWWCQTTSVTPWLSPSIRKREVSWTAGTTGVFPSSQLQEKSLRESSLILISLWTDPPWDTVRGGVLVV